ncbi:MAG: phosphotransferase [Leifsonia sp.]
MNVDASHAQVSSWLTAAGRSASTLRIDEHYLPGADSLAIVRGRVDDWDFVAKAGPPDIVAVEHQFVSRLNATFSECRHKPFAERLGYAEMSGYAVTFMAAAQGETLDVSLFDDPACVNLSDDAVGQLTPYLDVLFGLYLSTMRSGEAEASPYLYRDRFSSILESETYRIALDRHYGSATLAEQSRPSTHPPVRLAELVRELRRYTNTLVAPWTTLIHGDVHCKNLLRDEAGRPVLIDPRTIWDGVRRNDEGRGDPAYDMGTLLHSVWPMSAVLAHVEHGHDLEETLGSPPQQLDDLVGHLTRRLHTLDPTQDCSIIRARLCVSAANALVGWLKYPAALATRTAWTRTLEGAVHYLESALQELDHEEREGGQECASR